MARIYSMAKCDILWLGDDPDGDADTVFKVIQELPHRIYHIPTRGKARTYAVRDIVYDVLGYATISIFHRVMKNRPVWRRVWIIQELVVAKSINMQCGLRSIPWDSLILFLEALPILDSLRSGDWKEFGLSQRLLIIASCVPAIFIDVTRVDYWEPDANTPILELWQNLEDFAATDPRDRIFALLGLSAPCFQLQADYTKPASEVFITVIQSAISQTKNLDALCIGHTDMSAREQPGIVLPTWVPDFSTHALNYIIEIAKLPLYLASGTTVVPPDTYILLSSDTSILYLFGIQLDIISKAYLASCGMMSWDDLRARIEELPRDIFTGQYHTGESWLLAYARTITGDMAFGDIPIRQSKQEAESLSRDLKSLLSWKGRLHRFLPNLIQSRTLDSLQRRERTQPKFLDRTAGFLNYRFSTTAKGFMAMIPHTAKEGDILCVLYGSRLPHVLRKVRGEEGTYTMVGTAYVHGFMDAEAIEWRDQGKLKEQRFKLI